METRAEYLRRKFWEEDEKNGSPIGKPYKEVEYILTHSMQEGWPLRKQKLHDLLDYARQHSSFYSKYDGYDLNAYPVMTKTMMIEHYDEIKVNPDCIPGQNGPVFIQRTSGSTGNPLAMPQDTRKRQRRIAEIKYMVGVLGYQSHEKMIHLRTWDNLTRRPEDMEEKDNIYPFDIKNLSEDRLKLLCDLINEKQAVYLRGYASTFDRIADVVLKYGYSFPTLKLVVATSESLEDDVRQKAMNAFGCNVVSQYSDEECGLLAQESIPTLPKDNRMYFNWSGYYIEVLKMEEDTPAEYGELGRIVLTDFHNHAFPVIRYDTGDTCLLLPPDEKSNGYPVMGKLYGRRFDLTYATDGTPIYPLAYGRILKNYDSILSWQFVQKGCKDYALVLVLKYEDSEGIFDMIRQIKSFLGDDANIEVERVNEIPLLRSGKRKPVKNDWKK
jgi:phenylacetate-CoA ligase